MVAGQWITLMSNQFKPGIYVMGRCNVIVAIENGRWHLSISISHCSPSYKEIKEARYRFIPDNVSMAQLFPPTAEFVNVHPYCHHLWEIRDKWDD